MSVPERVKVKGVLPVERTPFTQEHTAAARVLEKKPTPEVPAVLPRVVPGEELKVPENRIQKNTPLEVGHTVGTREPVTSPSVPQIDRVPTKAPELPAYSRTEDRVSPALPEREKAITGVDVARSPLLAPEVPRRELTPPEVPNVERRVLPSPSLPALSDRLPTGSPESPVIPRPIESTPLVDPKRLNRRDGIMTAQTVWN